MRSRPENSTGEGDGARGGIGLMTTIGGLGPLGILGTGAELSVF